MTGIPKSRELHRRITFWRGAVVRGGASLGHIGGTVTFLVGGSLLAVVAFTAGLRPLSIVAVVLLLVLTLVAEGAYRLWDEADQGWRDAEAELSTLRDKHAKLKAYRAATEDLDEPSVVRVRHSRGTTIKDVSGEGRLVDVGHSDDTYASGLNQLKPEQRLEGPGARRAIVLADLIDENGEIADRTFNNESFMGPAVVAFPDCRLEAIQLVTPNLEWSLWPVEGTKVGAVVFRRCTLSHCTFVQVGFAGSQRVIDKWRKALGQDDQ
jgi:hypothetical protein